MRCKYFGFLGILLSLNKGETVSDLSYEVKPSMQVFILCMFACLFGEAIFMGTGIYTFITLINGEYESFKDPTSQLCAGIIVLSFCMIISVLIICLSIYFIKTMIEQVDVYTEDKLYRKRKDKIIFEINYSNIIDIKESYFNCLLLYCDKGFIKSNSKNILRSQTTFMEHYNRKDIIKIVEIITNYIKISKNKDKLYENNN